MQVSGRIGKYVNKKHRWIIIVSLVSLIILAAGFNVWYLFTTNQKIYNTEAQQRAYVTEMDEYIEKATKARIAREKAQQEAAAKQAAEAAQTATESTASSLNSSDCNTQSNRSAWQ